MGAVTAIAFHMQPGLPIFLGSVKPGSFPKTATPRANRRELIGSRPGANRLTALRNVRPRPAEIFQLLLATLGAVGGIRVAAGR